MNPPNVNDEDTRNQTKSLHCKRNISTERIQHMKRLSRMKQEQNVLERDLNNSLENMKVEPKIKQDLLNDKSEFSTKRQEIIDNLIKTTSSIADDFKFIKRVAFNSEEIQKLDITGYKSKLIDLYGKIREFKEKCPLQVLSAEQLAIDSDLQMFTPNLQKYKEPVHNTILNQNKTYNITKNLQNNESKNGSYDEYSEIQDFHKLVAKTGHTGNWSNEDHLLFLKVRKKCRTIPALVSTIRDKCPDLSAENIVNHEAWYKTYLSLREKQKEKLKEWHARKKSEEIKKLEEGRQNIEEQFQDTKKHVSVAESSTTPNCNDASKKTKKILNPNNVNELQTDKKKELIKQWKAEKEKKLQMDEEQIKIQIKQKRAKEEQRRRMKTKRIQANIGVVCESKLLQNEMQEISKNTNVEKSNRELLKAFRKRDTDIAKKRRHLILHRKRTKSWPTKISPSEVKTRKSTLFNSTEVWKEKCKYENSKPKEIQEIQYIKDIPKIATRWKNEESMSLRM